MDFRIRRAALTDPQDAEQVWWDVVARPFDELLTPYEPDQRLQMLTPGQRALYALYWLRSEIDNGGFHQFLLNPTGILANDALSGAELVGAAEFAELLREVRSLFSADPFVDDHARRVELLDRLPDDALATLDGKAQRFYELMGYEDGSVAQSRLAAYCAEYVDSHPQDFFLPHAALEPPKL